MSTTLVRLAGDGPLYRQIYDSLRDDILSGRLKPETRLPATRELADELGVSRNTVLEAYERLKGEGYAQARTGSGTYVTATLPEALLTAESRDLSPAAGTTEEAAPRVSTYGRRLEPAALDLSTRESRHGGIRYDFRYGSVDPEILPLRIWRRLVGRQLRNPALGYARPEGNRGLREQIVSYLARARAIQADPEQVIVVAGSQQGLDLVARLMVDPGDAVAVEEPGYSGAREAFRAAGAELVPVPVDEDGLVVEKLAARRRGPPLRLAYVTPSHQFPSGSVLSLPRRLQLLEWAERSGSFILEDDYDGEYRYEARPLEALRGLDRRGSGGRVIYLGTFSKILFPALRLGYLVVPRPLLPYFRAAKWLADRQTPELLQAAMADFIREGHFESFLRRARLTLAARRAALLEALAAEFRDRVVIQGANAGVHVLVWLPGLAAERIGDLVERAASMRVGIESVDRHHLRAPERVGLLLGYGALDEEGIREGVRVLARAVSRC